MRQLLTMLFLCMCHLCMHAQANPATNAPASVDTSFLLQELKTLLDANQGPSSYVSLGLGVGNRLFSLHNNQLNAKQATSSTLVLTPSLGYFHKSGFSISAGASLLNDVTKGYGATQYSISPAYSLTANKDINAGISYTRYLVSDLYSVYASPVQNDFYGDFTYLKPWLQPGIAIGYSTGVYKQVRSKDTVINNIRRYRYDSMTNHLKAFTFVVSASHSFNWTGVLHTDDDVDLSPSLMLNMGSSVVKIDHVTNAPNLLAFLDKRGKLKRQQKTGFTVESLGMSIDAVYSIGNFSFNPQLYLDYYLPKTDETRFTQVFTLSAAYQF